MKRAAIYCRISQDTEGEALGVARQEADCRDLAASRGLEVVDVYVDNDTGASANSRKKKRPQYDRMLADAEARRIGVILAYSNSRLTRRPLELEGLIDLNRDHGTRIYTVVSGDDDLSTADGRMVARIKASVDAAEAERTAERVARKHRESAEAGRPVGGTRPFGWEDDKVTVRESEAAFIREAATDLIAGVRMAAIVKRWNEAGLTTSRGKLWTHGLVLQCLRSPRLAGWRVHRPKGTPWTPTPPVALKDGQPVRGQWEPILSDETHRALLTILNTNPERRVRVPKRNSRGYLLTGMLRCSVCNGTMYANRVKTGYHYYKCDTGNGHNNSASGKGLEALVEARVLEYAELIETLDLDGNPVTDDAMKLQQTIDDCNEMIDELMSSYRAKHISAKTAFANVEKLEVARDQAIRERDAATAQALAAAQGEVTPETWAAMDLDRRRGVVERLLKVVLVNPATRRGNTFDESRIELVWAR